MNQILSVELNKNKSKKKNDPNKADIKSVMIFFSIFLIIFGLTTTSLGIYSTMKKENSNQVASNDNMTSNDNIKIDVAQNASVLELEVLADYSITSIEYSWNGEETKSLSVDGSSNITAEIDVPSGTNLLKVVAKDANGNTKEFEKNYVGENIEEPNIVIFEETYNNENFKDQLEIKISEETNIKSISYYYDDDEPTTEEVNATEFTFNIDIKTGEHKLTIQELDVDGNEKKATKTVYIPDVNVSASNDYSELKITATGKDNENGMISKVHINFNDEESDINDINSATFERTLESKDGENRLIIEVYNNSGLKITKRIRWEK